MLRFCAPQPFCGFRHLSVPKGATAPCRRRSSSAHGHRDAPPVNCVVQPRPVRECTHSGAASIDVGYEHTVLRSAATKLDGAAAARGRLQPGDAPWRRGDDHAARRAERVDACHRPLDPVLRWRRRPSKNWPEWRLALLAEAGQEPEAAGGTIRCRNQQLERRLIEDYAPILFRAQAWSASSSA